MDFSFIKPEHELRKNGYYETKLNSFRSQVIKPSQVFLHVRHDVFRFPQDLISSETVFRRPTRVFNKYTAGNKLTSKASETDLYPNDIVSRR